MFCGILTDNVMHSFFLTFLFNVTLVLGLCFVGVGESVNRVGCVSAKDITTLILAKNTGKTAQLLAWLAQDRHATAQKKVELWEHYVQLISRKNKKGFVAQKTVSAKGAVIFKGAETAKSEVLVFFPNGEVGLYSHLSGENNDQWEPDPRLATSLTHLYHNEYKLTLESFVSDSSAVVANEGLSELIEKKKENPYRWIEAVVDMPDVKGKTLQVLVWISHQQHLKIEDKANLVRHYLLYLQTKNSQVRFKEVWTSNGGVLFANYGASVWLDKDGNLSRLQVDPDTDLSQWKYDGQQLRANFSELYRNQPHITLEGFRRGFRNPQPSTLMR